MSIGYRKDILHYYRLGVHACSVICSRSFGFNPTAAFDHLVFFWDVHLVDVWIDGKEGNEMK